MSHAAIDGLVLALTALASEQNLCERAVKGFEASLRNVRSDSPDQIDGWTVEDIESRFTSCSLVFADEYRDYPFVDTRLQVCVRDQIDGYLHPIGYYRLLTRLDGTFDDDFLVFHAPKSTKG